MKGTLRRIALAAVLAAASAQGAAAKTLVFCSEGNPEALNPQLVTTTTGLNATIQMFNMLVEFEPGTTRLVPSLAESWSISPDGLVYTFRLRRGVKFHSNADFQPSRDMNADDVLFSLERQWKTSHPYHKVSGSNYDYFKDMSMPELLKSIEKVDDHTIRIELTRPEAPFLANMAMPFNAVMSAEYAELLLRRGTPEKFDHEPIGTGPFQFDSFEKDVAVRYRAFADYWQGRRPVDILVFSITPNPAVRLNKLKAGECHVMAFPSPDHIPEMSRDPSIVVHRQEGFNIGYLSMNVTRKPFGDLRVRRAVNLAIDKKTLVEAAYEGAGLPAVNPVPPTLWAYDHHIRDYPYDPAEARRLLAEAGFPEGFETDLWYMPVSRPYMPNAKRVAEMIQADLLKVGIRTRLVTEEWSAYRRHLQNGDHGMGLFGWTGDNGDPDNFLYVMLGCAASRVGGSNVAKWCDERFDALVREAKVVADQNRRAELYSRALRIFKDEAVWVPVAHSVVFMATRKEVTGFRMDPLGRYALGGLDLVQ